MKITGDPNRDFAPIAKLHKNEKHFPDSPNAFIRDSKLWFTRKGKNKLVSANPTARKLGAGDYRFNMLGGPLTADDMTRPYQAGNAGASKNGFYLELPDGRRAGTKPTGTSIRTPMYRQDVGSMRVFWMFYNFSQATLSTGKPLPVGHEGDWERVIVDLTSWKVPRRVGHVAHHEPVAWRPYVGLTTGPPPAGGVRTQGLNPLGYVSRLGHGTWPEPGTHKVCVIYLLKCGTDFTADGGYDWDASQHQLPISKAAWFGNPADHAKCRRGAPRPAASLRCGFGGAWGSAGNLADTTGPLGPSAYKLATRNG
jgi:hypothetical protein